MARSGRDWKAPEPERNGALGATAGEGQPVRLRVLVFEGAESDRVFGGTEESEGGRRSLSDQLQALAPPGWLVKSCGSLEEAVAALARKPGSAKVAPQPQFAVVVDLRLQARDGIIFVRRLRTAVPDLPILVLSEGKGRRALEALMAGASGHVYGPQSGRQVLMALECMVRGETVLCQRSQEGIVRILYEVGSLQAEWKLTPKQQDVMSGLLRGLLNKEIAVEMGTTEGTVHTQLAEIYRKLEVHSRTGAVRKFLESRCER